MRLGEMVFERDSTGGNERESRYLPDSYFSRAVVLRACAAVSKGEKVKTYLVNIYRNIKYSHCIHSAIAPIFRVVCSMVFDWEKHTLVPSSP